MASEDPTKAQSICPRILLEVRTNTARVRCSQSLRGAEGGLSFLARTQLRDLRQSCGLSQVIRRPRNLGLGPCCCHAGRMDSRAAGPSQWHIEGEEEETRESPTPLKLESRLLAKIKEHELMGSAFSSNTRSTLASCNRRRGPGALIPDVLAWKLRTVPSVFNASSSGSERTLHP
jgi:hypothetical protein